MKKIIFTLFIYIGLSTIAIAQVAPNMAKSTVMPGKTIVEQQNEKLKEQILELKIQNEITNKFQSSILSTVYWSLGFLGTIATLLVGFGWWSNFKIHEKDKESIKNEALSLITDFESKWNASISEFRREDTVQYEKRMQDVLNYADKITDKITLEVKDINQYISQIKDELKQVDIEVKSNKSDNVKHNHTQDYALRLVEIEVWGIKGVHSNVLLTLAQGLRSALNLDDKDVEFLLVQIEEKLEELVKDDYVCGEFSYKRVKEVIQDIANHDVLINNILTLLSQLKTKP